MQTYKAINAFIKSRQAKGLSRTTIRWYCGILAKFNQHCRTLPTKAEPIESFMSQLHAGDERRHGYYRTLRVLYNFLEQRMGVRNPIKLIGPPIRSQKEPQWLMPEELHRLLVYPHPPLIKTALLFLADTGSRLGELVSLRFDNITETPWGYIASITGKTGTRIVPISYETYHALVVNLPITCTAHHLGKLIARAFHKAEVRGTAHSLRHTFATLWEGDELVLQQIMGHSHLSTTKQYRHLRAKLICLQHRQYTPLRMIGSSKDMFML